MMSSDPMVSVGPTVSLVVESVTDLLFPASSLMVPCRFTKPCARADTSMAVVANCPETDDPQTATVARDSICTPTFLPFSEQVPLTEYAVWLAAVIGGFEVNARSGRSRSTAQV